MNKGLKKSLIVGTILLVLIFIGGHFALKFFGEAFGADCEKSNSWSVGEYEIQEYKCIGWAGPYYSHLYLYKNNEELSENGKKLDSCTMRFKIRDSLYLKLDICNNRITQLKPQKKLLDFNEIDSIIMFSIELNTEKVLKADDIKKFVQMWNNAPAFGIRDEEKPFYPNASFIIKVYTTDSLREFETGNWLIKNDGNWVYSFLESGEKTNVKKFEKMWNEIKTTANK